MVKDIIDGISNALYENFKGVTIYSESIEQGFEEPCFFVMPLNSSEIPLIGVRAFRSVPLDVHYFPKSEKEAYAEMENVASKLYGILRRITLLDGSMLNGFNLNHKAQDGVLHFFVEFKPPIRYVTEPDEMQESLDHNIEVENDETKN